MVGWHDVSPAERAILETIFRSAGVSPAELAQYTEFSRRKASDAVATLLELAGTLIGRMQASAVNLFSPAQIMISGGVPRIGPLFLALHKTRRANARLP